MFLYIHPQKRICYPGHRDSFLYIIFLCTHPSSKFVSFFFKFVSTLLHLSSFPIQLAPSFPIQQSPCAGARKWTAAASAPELHLLRHRPQRSSRTDGGGLRRRGRPGRWRAHGGVAEASASGHPTGGLLELRRAPRSSLLPRRCRSSLLLPEGWSAGGMAWLGSGGHGGGGRRREAGPRELLVLPVL